MPFHVKQTSQRDTLLLEDKVDFESVAGIFTSTPLNSAQMVCNFLTLTVYEQFIDKSFHLDASNSAIAGGTALLFGWKMKNPRAEDPTEEPRIISIDGVIITSQEAPLAPVPFIARDTDTPGFRIDDFRLLPGIDNTIVNVGNPGGQEADFGYIGHWNTQVILDNYNNVQDENDNNLVIGFALVNLSNNADIGTFFDFIRGRVTARVNNKQQNTFDSLR